MEVNMNIIELIKVIILGIVEGITEWLPISSTGHMILVDEFIKLDVSADFCCDSIRSNTCCCIFVLAKITSV